MEDPTFNLFTCQDTPALTLADLGTGEVAKIHGIDLQTGLDQRLMALGFLPGQPVKFLKTSPLKDPILVEIGSRVVSLRREEARRVVVGRTV
jgi:Fe2+ transport system protein FeoA